MRQNAAAQNDGIRPRETIFADLDRLGGLAAGIEINAVSKQLRTKSSDGGERADAHARGAIDEMAAAYSSMIFDDQLRAPVRLMSEMPAGAARKSSNPIELADDGMRAQMEKVDVLAEGEMADARAFFHDEAARQNPGEADVAVGMNRIAKLFLQERAAHLPRQKQGKEHEKRFHATGASER